jgi:hypothetical protein
MKQARIVFLLLASLCLPVAGRGQSLGSVAKKERERRDKNKKEGVAAREISEEEVFGDDKAKENEKTPEDDAGEKAESGGEPSSTEAVIPGVNPNADEQGDKFEKESRERKRSEAEWRSRASKARARIAKAREMVSFFEELHLGPAERYVDVNGNTVVESAEQLQQLTRQAKEELAAAEGDWKKIQDEARRSGVPPGWLR